MKAKKGKKRKDAKGGKDVGDGKEISKTEKATKQSSNKEDPKRKSTSLKDLTKEPITIEFLKEDPENTKIDVGSQIR